MARFQVIFAYITLLAPVAFAAAVDSHPFIAPTASDVRSPCPGLNTLANHGFLPRDGKNITIDAVLQAAIDGYNVQPDAILLAAKIGLTASEDVNVFSLADIRLHDSIEHDASLSRGDFANGDNFSFNETVFQTLLNSNPDKDFYDGTSAGQVQKDRLDVARAENPKLKNTPKEFAIRTRESSLYLAVMGNITSGQAPKNFVQIFFREERLPIAEGWERSPVPITSAALQPVTREIVNASQWTPDEGVCSSVALVLGHNSTFVV